MRGFRWGYAGTLPPFRARIPPEVFGISVTRLTVKGWRGFHRTLFERGGRERESNPPRTDPRPLPDLKSGRPTGDDSLPETDFSAAVASPARLNRSRRGLLMRRTSPQRKVTPWRSKNSRIWIATLRPLSTRSRN